MKKKTTKGFSAVSNKEFANDMKKAYKKKKTSGVIKSVMKQMPNKSGVNLQPKSQIGLNGAGLNGAPYAFDADNTFASSDPTISGSTPQAILKKKTKMKAAKKKSATKKKVSHVLQETSCKKCKTSHKPGMHKDVKKSPNHKN